MGCACAFVLAGGRSSRMGADKAFIEFDGQTLLNRSLQLGAAACSDVRIVGSRGKFQAFAQVVEDQFPDHGPLGGIHAALRASNCDLNLILGVDMPFMKGRFLRYLVDLAQAETAVVTVPRVGGAWQPLCALYRRQFADLAERALQQGKNKIDPLFAQVDVRVVDEDEFRTQGFHPAMFRNLNTPEELREAREACSKGIES